MSDIVFHRQYFPLGWQSPVNIYSLTVHNCNDKCAWIKYIFFQTTPMFKFIWWRFVCQKWENFQSWQPLWTSVLFVLTALQSTLMIGMRTKNLSLYMAWTAAIRFRLWYFWMGWLLLAKCKSSHIYLGLAQTEEMQQEKLPNSLHVRLQNSQGPWEGVWWGCTVPRCAGWVKFAKHSHAFSLQSSREGRRSTLTGCFSTPCIHCTGMKHSTVSPRPTTTTSTTGTQMARLVGCIACIAVYTCIVLYCSYELSDKRRLEMNEGRAAEGFLTYWFLELSQRWNFLHDLVEKE